MNYTDNLERLKRELNDAQQKKYRAEARLEQLKTAEKELLEKISQLGLKPEELEEEINRLKGEIEELFKEASELLPREYYGN